MTQALIIVLVGVVFLHDAGGSWVQGFGLPPAAIVGLVLGVYAGIGLSAWLALSRAARLFDEGSRSVALTLAQIARVGSLLLAVAWHAAACLILGWINLVRTNVGDWVLLDETLLTIPAFAVFVVVWWAAYPLERRLREALALHALDRGHPVRRLPSRWQHLSDQIRHQALLILAPLALILAWTESLFFLDAAYAEEVIAALGEGGAALAFNGAQLFGVAIVFLIAPEMLRRIWSTRVLPPGDTRDALQRLLERQRVTCRQLLEWRTHGMLINAAVVGFVGPLRYILLSDALLEALSPQRIEAVMAHEVGHIRRRHLPWMLASVIAVFGLTLWTMLLLASGAAALLQAGGGELGGLLEGIATLGAILLSLMIFGFISRRFERQADAFAAQHLSGMTPDNASHPIQITPEAAHTMAAALDDVARLNHVAKRRFTWRHGSIAGRQQALLSLVGRPVSGLPIDRTVRRIKAASIVGLLALAGVTAIDWAIHAGDAAEQPSSATALAPNESARAEEP
jgi:STE24 endopeptidase